MELISKDEVIKIIDYDISDKDYAFIFKEILTQVPTIALDTVKKEAIEQFKAEVVVKINTEVDRVHTVGYRNKEVILAALEKAKLILLEEQDK